MYTRCCTSFFLLPSFCSYCSAADYKQFAGSFICKKKVRVKVPYVEEFQLAPKGSITSRNWFTRENYQFDSVSFVFYILTCIFIVRTTVEIVRNYAEIIVLSKKLLITIYPIEWQNACITPRNE